MAKKSVINRNNRREKLIAKYRETRNKLRTTISSPVASEEQKRVAQLELQRLPRDSAACRYKVRCQISGRGRAVYRKFRLSRILLRDMGHKGFIPGLIKASW